MIINLHNVHYPAHASNVINILYIGAIISTFVDVTCSSLAITVETGC